VRDRFTHRLKRELPLAAILARGYARAEHVNDFETRGVKSLASEG
jgi:hypothetical protein